MGTRYCPLCNTSFGSAEEGRKRADGREVHEHCIFAKGRKEAYIEVCADFLVKNVGRKTADEFVAAVRRNHSPGLFAAALSRALRSGWNKRKFREFARKVGGDLAFEVRMVQPREDQLRVVNADE